MVAPLPLNIMAATPPIPNPTMMTTRAIMMIVVAFMLPDEDLFLPGTTVVATAGAAVVAGAVVGAGIGTALGSSGMRVGMDVGTGVGAGVGTLVGVADGMAVGSTLGLGVGMNVGSGDGAGDGEKVATVMPVTSAVLISRRRVAILNDMSLVAKPTRADVKHLLPQVDEFVVSLSVFCT